MPDLVPSRVDDMSDFLSTQEVARLAGVSPSAVKRWADGGQLRCLKTAGGHRRFERAEVERFLAGHAGGAPAPLVDALLSARDALEVQGLLLAERARLGAWWRVGERLGEALAELGQRWRDGAISILEEHQASERLARALARIGEALPVATDAPRALLACAEGDEHGLGLGLAELALREAGWATRWAGPRTPTAELERAIGAGGVELLAVSASAASADALGLRRQAEALARACKVAGVTLVLGGAGAWPERPRYGSRLRGLEPLYLLAEAERARRQGPGSA